MAEITQLFDAMTRQLRRNDRVMVESVPKGPGHHIYRIVGISRDDVQQEINRLMGAVETAPGDGLCSFDGPHKLTSGPDAGLYAAEGMTKITAAPVLEAV
jgi:hypothetical protein